MEFIIIRMRCAKKIADYHLLSMLLFFAYKQLVKNQNVAALESQPPRYKTDGQPPAITSERQK